MTGSILESLLVGLMLLAGITFLVVLTGGFLLWRYGRRKLTGLPLAWRGHRRDRRVGRGGVEPLEPLGCGRDRG